MKQFYLIRKHLVIFLLIVFSHQANHVIAQSKHKYEEHEIIEAGNGLKVEILTSRGEGANEEYDVIYYTDSRQEGKRVWEKASKILELQQAEKETHNGPKILSVSSVDQKPKALMPKKTYAKSATLITSVTNRLLARDFSSDDDQPLNEKVVEEPAKKKNARDSTITKATEKAVVKNQRISSDTIKGSSTTAKKTTSKKTILPTTDSIKEVTNKKPLLAAKLTSTSVEKKSSAAANMAAEAKNKIPTTKVKSSPDTVRLLQDNLATATTKKSAPFKVDSSKMSLTKATLSPNTTTPAKLVVEKISARKDSSKLMARNKVVVTKINPKRDTLQVLSHATSKSVAKKDYEIPSSITLRERKYSTPPSTLHTIVRAQFASSTKVNNSSKIIPEKTSLKKNFVTVDFKKMKPHAEIKNVAKTQAQLSKSNTLAMDEKRSFTPSSVVKAKESLPKSIEKEDSSIFKLAVNKPFATSVGTLRDSTNNVNTTYKNAVVKTTVAIADPSKSTPVISKKVADKKATLYSKGSRITAKYKYTFDSSTAIHVAVFAPLYIDDAFTGDMYNLGKSNLPRNILTGLEFYNGVMMAIDSLSQEGINAEVMIYDTRESARRLTQILESPELNNVGLVIAQITNITELKTFSEFSARKNVPLISATYPNTVGVTENPFFVLLNSSFPVHLDGLYRYIQRAYPADNIIAVRRPGATEDFIKNYLNDLNKASRIPLKIKWLDLKETFTLADLAKNLDSTKNNIVFVASPNEAFGLKVVKTLNTNPSYRTTAIGMPTWDGIRELNGRDCSNVEIVYSTPFLYNSQNASLSTELVRKYRDKYYSRPSDIAYKGYETTYHFTKLLSKYQSNLVNNLSDKAFILFNQFDIQPVKVHKNSLKPDYLENKKLYFIKKQEGNIKSIM